MSVIFFPYRLYVFLSIHEILTLLTFSLKKISSSVCTCTSESKCICISKYVDSWGGENVLGSDDVNKILKVNLIDLDNPSANSAVAKHLFVRASLF